MHPPKMRNRQFGVQFGMALAAIGVLGWWRDWWVWLVVMLAIMAASNISLAWLAPEWLSPINTAWMGLGQVLGKVVAPIVLGLMFALLFTPMALIMRVWGRDELKLRDHSGESFWLFRAVPDIDAASFRNQY